MGISMLAVVLTIAGAAAAVASGARLVVTRWRQRRPYAQSNVRVTALRHWV